MNIAPLKVSSGGCRAVLRFLGEFYELHPGQHVPRKHNSWGKTMPSRVIRGGSNSELEKLTVIALRVTGQCLSGWEFAVAPFCP